MNISFKKASFEHKDTIFTWLDKLHVKEFWDNSQEHRDDIINFMEGRKTPAPYFKGITDYWVGFIDNDPYCFLLTSVYRKDQELQALHREHLSKIGKTYSIDFCIGDTNHLGKGLAAPTLEAFTQFFQKEVDQSANTFFIDPGDGNPRAIRVYEKAGFKTVGYFPVTEGFFEGSKSLLMVKQMREQGDE